MDMTKFAANLGEARRIAIIVVEAKNIMAREHSSNRLDAVTENMIEELNTIVIGQCRVDKDALLRSLLEDAELQIERYSKK